MYHPSVMLNTGLQKFNWISSATLYLKGTEFRFKNRRD